MSSSSLNKLFIPLFLFFSPVSGITTPLPPIWQVPHENPSFIGREILLQKIHEKLQTSPDKIVVIYGPSGFGKSQVAKKYVYQHYLAYDVVWWFRGNSYLEPQFKNFALALSDSLNIPSFKKTIENVEQGRLIFQIKEMIRKKNLKCLVVFDDASTYKSIEPYIPFSHGKNVHVLITTKNANFSMDGIAVRGFLRKESIVYINRFLPHENKKAQYRLASYFADCPSSLAIALDYIRSYPGMTINMYIEKHGAEAGSCGESLKSAVEKFGSPLDAYEKDLFTTIKISLEELKKTSKESFELIQFVSLLDHEQMPLNFLKEWMKRRKINTDLSALLHLINQSSLIDKTFLDRPEGTYLNMHELIQKIISTFIPIEEKRKLIDEAVSVIMPYFSGQSDENANKLLKDSLPVLHASKVSREADKIGYHTNELAALRVRLFDVLLCGFRDREKAKEISRFLEEDLKNGIALERKDLALYNINMAVFLAPSFADYHNAIHYSTLAFNYLKNEEGFHGEKIRIIANLL